VTDCCGAEARDDLQGDEKAREHHEMRRHCRFIPACGLLCPKQKVECHVPIFDLKDDVDVAKMDVLFACSYL
jgi:ribosomal protein S10